jgi:hypothetical protein
MADTFTTNLNLTKPEVGASTDTWGTKINADLDALDAIFAAGGTAVNVKFASANFDDNAKAIFGTGDDLEIYHSGSHSIIKDGGTGNLLIQGDSVKIMNAAGDETFIDMPTDSYVALNYNNSTKIQTSNTGATITGTLVATALDISGDVDIDGTLETDNLTIGSQQGTDGQVLTSTGSGVGWEDAAAGTTINNNADNRVITGSGTANTLEGEANFIFDGKNVGINRASVTQHATDVNTLAIESDKNGKAGAIQLFSANDSVSSVIHQDTTGLALITNSSTSGARNDIVFQTASSEKMKITEAGLVGIGTSSPNYLLGVHKGSSDANYIQITNSTTGSGSGDGAIIGLGSDEALNVWQFENEPINFGTNNNTRMTIDSSGNVGIGAAPTNFTNFNNLDVRSKNTSGGAVIGIHDTNGDRVGCISHNETTTAFDIEAFNSNVMRFHTDGTERMRVNNDGRLLVGRTSVIQSDNMIAVSGSGTGAGNAIVDIRNTSTSDTCGCLSLSKGTTTTTSANRYIWFFANNFGTNMGAIGGNGVNNVQFVTSSDERLKENIQPITGSLDKILALNPVSFDWKENGEHREAGFIAQEVEKVLPEYVNTEDDEMKTKSITGGMTAGYIAVLTKAIQEQQTQIEALQSEINTLKGE